MSQVRWGRYLVRPDRPQKSYDEASRATALRWHDELMAEKESRKEGLFELLSRNGVALSPARDTDEDLERVGDWFFANVSGDPNAPSMGEALVGAREVLGFDLLMEGKSPNAPSRVADEWDSFAMDAHLWRGDILVDRAPEYSWSVPKPKKRSESYNRSVVCLFELDPPTTLFSEVDFHMSAIANGLAHLTGLKRRGGLDWVEGMAQSVDKVRYLPMTKAERAAAVQAWLDEHYP